MIMTDNIRLIPEETRQTILKTIIDAQRKAVVFELHNTKCPVCSLFGMTSTIIIRSTQQEKRYCECLRCTCNFTAIGEKFEKKIIEENPSKYLTRAKKGKYKK